MKTWASKMAMATVIATIFAATCAMCAELPEAPEGFIWHTSAKTQTAMLVPAELGKQTIDELTVVYYGKEQSDFSGTCIAFDLLPTKSIGGAYADATDAAESLAKDAEEAYQTEVYREVKEVNGLAFDCIGLAFDRKGEEVQSFEAYGDCGDHILRIVISAPEDCPSEAAKQLADCFFTIRKTDQ